MTSSPGSMYASATMKMACLHGVIRTLDWSQGMPLSLRETYTFDALADYRALLPTDLPPVFTAKTFSRATGLRGYDLYDALAVFAAVGALEKGDKQGRSQLWRVIGGNQ